MPWESELEEGVHRSDVRTVTVTLSSANYRFDIVQPMDTKDVERSNFAVGETVRLRTKMTNRGTVKSDCRIVVTDSDTGDTLKDETFEGMGPDEFIDAIWIIGKMPDRDWHLLVEVSP